MAVTKTEPMQGNSPAEFDSALCLARHDARRFGYGFLQVDPQGNLHHVPLAHAEDPKRPDVPLAPENPPAVRFGPSLFEIIGANIPHHARTVFERGSIAKTHPAGHRWS